MVQCRLHLVVAPLVAMPTRLSRLSAPAALLLSFPRVRSLVVPPTIDRQASLIAGFRERIAECNREGPPSTPFYVGSDLAGRVPNTLASFFAGYPEIFDCSDDAINLKAKLVDASVDERTAAIATVTAAMREAGLVKGWRDELLSVSTAYDAPPAFLVERTCLPLFGAKGYGVHVNGWCVDPSTNEPCLWVATRALSKPTWPGMLDHLVAGAQPAGLSPSENVVKEAGEEAGVPEELAKTAVPVSICSYVGTDEFGQLKRDVLFNYDLQLPWDFEPKAVDGEVESFERWPLSKVADAVAFGKPAFYKPNCNLVVIDFLVRRGFLTPDAPGYVELVSGLRV